MEEGDTPIGLHVFEFQPICSELRSPRLGEGPLLGVQSVSLMLPSPQEQGLGLISFFIPSA